jgi:hypothetical protein
MPLAWDDIQANAIAFSKRWKDAGKEEQEAQNFVTDFLRVFGVDEPLKTGELEFKIPLVGGTTGYVDYLWKKKIAIEMKSRGKDLAQAFKQLQTYMQNLPEDDIPDLWIACDFESIHLCRRSENKIFKFKTKDLHKHIKYFADIAGYASERIRDSQVEVNVKAAEKMARLHDALKTHGYEGHDLEVYLVRLLFCLFADDTGIFPQDSFFRYIQNSKPDGSDLCERIAKLFDVLNMPDETRTKRTLLSDELKQFRYINGALFQDRLPIAEFDAKMRKTLIDCINFDWNNISPAIFGAMFQGVMDKDQRRMLGAHYTSEENILKLINPLFMDELYKEFNRVKTDPAALDNFHNKIARLKFLDPACGCGNFLIITYRELRTLELEVLKMKSNTSQLVTDITHLLKVSVEQFYGIECEDFPCQIAQVGMWLTDHQMNIKASELLGQYFARLPLNQSATIVHGNALRIDWEDVVAKRELSYILGNPPFVGHQWRNAEQQEDMQYVYKNNNKFGKLDYVCCWYQKAIDFMMETRIRAAFVSTNSIVQGESVSIMWKPIFEQGFEIVFAYTPFIWSNEAKGKAAVHCVIIGFAQRGSAKIKHIFAQDTITETDNINGYLLPAPDIFIQSRGKPLTAGMPKMSKGSQPTDGGYLILSPSEREEMIMEHPQTAAWIKRYLVSDDFINDGLRYCLWLKGIMPKKYRSIKSITKRFENIAQIRKQSPTKSVQRDAETPMLFTQIRQPQTDFLVIPRVSSERRKYIPMGFLSPDVIVGDRVQFIPNATLYHFGILTSNVHMAWTRVVCGRLKSDYNYSPAVYNNFPWPDATDEQKTSIEKLAQCILDTRANFPDSSLADLYDPLTMPPELLKAHRDLDRAVMKLYGFSVKDMTEAGCVAALMERYRGLVVENSLTC